MLRRMDDTLVRKVVCAQCREKIDAALEHQKLLARVREAEARLTALMGARKPRVTKTRKAKPKKATRLHKANGSATSKGTSIIPDKEVVRYINGRASAGTLAKKYKCSTQLVYARASQMRKRFGVPSPDPKAKASGKKTTARLNIPDSEIVRFINAGVSAAELAKKYGCSPQNIYFRAEKMRSKKKLAKGNNGVAVARPDPAMIAKVLQA